MILEMEELEELLWNSLRIMKRQTESKEGAVVA
ncbi:hypothetical protein HMPREF0991_01617 [Lachnospiraceae bacterium 2_1_58FAA]|nr:hypothetical protein HMPREF0991_01617 [Lachnospiraceae bacterium 2_1_58FAA]